MKGIILAAGLGTRMQPFSLYTSKHLLPVWRHPLVHYPLSNLLTMGITEIAFVIPENPLIRSQYEILRMIYSSYADITFISQMQPAGMAHAVSLCKDWADNQPIVVTCGDCVHLLKRKQLEAIRSYAEADPTDVLLLGCVEEINCNDVARILVWDIGRLLTISDGDGIHCSITRVLEKPHHNDVPSLISSAGMYFLPGTVFDYLSCLKLSDRGEYELSDVFNMYACTGEACVYLAQFPWFDCGTLERLLATSILLRKYEKEGSYPCLLQLNSSSVHKASGLS